jgi:hypothetical protein
MPDKLKDSLGLIDATGNVLRTLAATLGPPLVRLTSGEGTGYAGLIRAPEAKQSATASLPFGTTGNARRIAKACTRCGSRDVQAYGQVEWSITAQDWECVEVFEDLNCPRCGNCPGVRDVPI